MPNESSGERQPRRRISPRRTLASSRERPPPLYSFGHSGTVQPRAAIRSNQRRCPSDLKDALRPPQ
jgi:hypothetical protein